MFKWFQNLGIQTKLVATYSFFILFPLLTAGTVSYTRWAHTAETQAVEFNNKIIGQISRNIDYNIKEVERISLTPFSDPDIQRILRKTVYGNELEMVNDQSNMDKMIFNLVTLRPDIVGVYVFPLNYADSDRIFYRSTSIGLKNGYDPSEEEWYDKALRANGQKVLIGTHLETQVIREPKKVFSLARKIKDVDYHKDLGVILINANLKAIREICKDSSMGKNGKIIITDQDGYVVYHTDEAEIGAKLDDGYSEVFSSQDSYFKREINGKTMIFSSTKSDYTKWTVIGVIPLKELSGNMVTVRNITIFIALGCVLMGVIVAVFIARGISRPLKQLQKLMSEVEKGNFDIQTRSTSHDEVGQLSYSFNIMIMKIKDLIKTVYDSQLLKKEAEFSALQSQINPHFLYNTLEVIRSIALEHGIKSIMDISKSLAKLFRYSISRDKEFVAIKEEIDYITNYLYIQKQRYGDKFDVIYNVDDEIYRYKCIRLLLQPLVENAVYHGMEMKMGKGLIEIKGLKEGNDICFQVMDDGIGINKEKAEMLNNAMQNVESTLHGNKQSTMGIGVLNVNARIKLYYGEQYGLRVGSQPDFGTIVEIRIPAVE